MDSKFIVLRKKKAVNGKESWDSLTIIQTWIPMMIRSLKVVILLKLSAPIVLMSLYEGTSFTIRMTVA